jgi:predicted metal-dependent hydrolase
MASTRQLDREIVDSQERARLLGRVRRLLDKWEPIVGVRVGDVRVKKMRAFATLNVRDRRLWVSQALVDMPAKDLEYVVVHELVHLLDPREEGSGHDERFYARMDRYLPGWRRRHARLRSGDVVARDLPGSAGSA